MTTPASGAPRALPSSTTRVSSAARRRQEALETTTFAFGDVLTAAWVASRIKGVSSATIGVGTGTDPPVCAPAVQVQFDTRAIGYETLVQELFWQLHDLLRSENSDLASGATSTDADVGRPLVVFAHTPSQRVAALRLVRRAGEAPPATAWSATDGRPAFEATICTAVEFLPTPEDKSGVLTRHLRLRADDFDRPIWTAVDGLALDDRQAIEDLRQIATEIGPCFDESLTGPAGGGGTPLIDLVPAMLVHDASLVRSVNRALRRWLSGRPSPGLAPGQVDVREMQFAVDPLNAEARIRARRTESMLLVIGNLLAGPTDAHRTEHAVGRRAMTEVSPAGAVVDRIILSRPTKVVPDDDDSQRRQMLARRPPLPARDPATSGQWYEHIPAAEMNIKCDGTTLHPVTWNRGRVNFPRARADDFNLYERTLVALGGPNCDSCRKLRPAWHPRFILNRYHLTPLARRLQPQPWWWGTLGHPGRREVFDPNPPSRRGTHLQVAGPRLAVQRLDAKQGDLLDLEVVEHQITPILEHQPVAFRTRWLLGALAWLEDHRDSLEPDDRTNLADLAFRHIEDAVLEALWQPCRSDPRVRLASLHFELLGRDDLATAAGHVGGTVAQIDVGVSFRWITQVWTRNLAVVDGHLVLDATGPPGSNELAVRATSWNRARDHSMGATLVTREATAYWSGAGWSLT